MNGPFFRNYSNYQPSRHSQSVPVHQTHQKPAPKPSPKVISVPVHFVSSDQPRTTMAMLKDSAAIKIQKVFRGFAVRKSVKRIAGIRNEVSEIERRIEDPEEVDLIRRDAKERLRVNETLMSLLFKLDSIRGVDCGVRELRKAVTKKAIALQEKVDSIAQININQQTLGSPDSRENDVDNSICTTSSDQVTKTYNSIDEIANNNSNNNDNVNSESEAIEADDEDETVVKEVVEEDVKNSNSVNAGDVISEVAAVESMETMEAMEASPSVSSAEFGENDDITTDLQKQKESDCANHAMETCPIVNSTDFRGKCDSDSATDVQKQKEVNCAVVNSAEFGGKCDAVTDNVKEQKNREILQSLVDDNEKMMRLMSQISERNEMQTRMINSLSRRVEQLERALASERHRKKKKTQVSLRRRRDQDSFCI